MRAKTMMWVLVGILGLVAGPALAQVPADPAEAPAAAPAGGDPAAAAPAVVAPAVAAPAAVAPAAVPAAPAVAPATAAAAEPVVEPVTESPALARLMEEWAELREQQIEVRGIEGLEAAGVGDGRAQVEARLKTLLTKKRSNREWYDYWREEQRISRAIAAAYEAEGTARHAARTRALVAWADLAARKLANQDAYFEAIGQDIDAVEERLRAFVDNGDEERLERSKSVCGREPARGETPLNQHWACVRATEAEVRSLEERQEQTQATRKLTEAQAASIELLVAAQARDTELVADEQAIAQAEAERARADAGETARWRRIWAHYAQQAAGKAVQLAEALRTSKNTRRVLGVNAAFSATELETLQGRLAEVEALKEERTSLKRLGMALLRTGWEFVVKGMVPIYILLAWLLLRLVKRGTKTLVARARAQPDAELDDIQRVETLASVGKGAIRLVVYVATTLLILDALTVDIGPIVGGAAIFGLAISFGSQSLVKDVVTGFFILLENQYAVGDSVDIGSSTGVVEKITLRRTVLRDLKGRLHNIPNGSINTVINNSQGWARVVIHLGVAYDTDLDEVKRIVDELGDAFFAQEEWASKLTEPPRYIGLTEFGDSALTVRIMFKTQTQQNWGAERAFNWQLKQALDAAGIEIPFPQRDVHLIPPAQQAETDKAPASS